jgi:pimeloyl-ACP methyl ester carboxylesterase
MVLCGREDALTPLEGHEEMAGAIPGAKLVVIEHCGHLSTLERPGQVSEAMKKWLESILFCGCGDDTKSGSSEDEY